MTEASEIPDDVMERAREVAEQCSIMSLQGQWADIIARALMEERERCAMLAEIIGGEYQGRRENARYTGESIEAMQIADTACDRVAAAIRGTDAPSG
jgi:hypothetical protein